MFIRNCWYVIAWDHEIGPDTLFTRTVLGEPLLVLRRADGSLAAMLDRCCHRLAPLSCGQREGDAVRCGYHGLKFDCAGQCIEVPGMARVPPHLKVRSYPVLTKNRWVFVWMGDPAAADETLLPDNFSNDHPGWCHQPGYMHYEVPYLLICDNLLDFSHLSYVHANTLGGSPEIARARQHIEPVRLPDGRPTGVKVTRRVPDVPPSPYWQSFRDGLEGRFERWFDYHFVLPGTLLMDSGGRPMDAPDDDSRTVRLHSCQTLTPETATSTHYFFQQSCQRRDFERAPDTVGRMYQTLVRAFHEDKDMISAQYRAILATPDLPMRPVPLFDGAVGQFRGLVSQWVDAERAAAAPAA
ncbi:MAG: aromatic ring-hydroxylating dioxygenase subunit alpha [Rubrivivax sp.]|nr:aromatic ring-hydroxylating dioxygenase subunit alpha [Rubrivivax sp.]